MQTSLDPVLRLTFVCGAVLIPAAVALYHFMIWRVNRGLPGDDQLPHSLRFGDLGRLSREYRRFYPRSILYHLTLSIAVVVMALAVFLVVYRIWEAAVGR